MKMAVPAWMMIVWSALHISLMSPGVLGLPSPWVGAVGAESWWMRALSSEVAAWTQDTTWSRVRRGSTAEGSG